MSCGRGNIGGRDEEATRRIKAQEAEKIAGLVSGEFRLYCAREGIELPPHAEVRLKSVWAISIASCLASRDREMEELQAELVDLRSLRTETLELYLTNEQKALQHRLATAQAALRDVLAMFDEGLIVRDISHDHEPNWIIKAASFTARLARNYQAINAEKEQK